MPAWIDTEGPGRRRQPRTAVRLDCLLTRRKGAPVSCHTIDLGPGGMCVASDRPLGVDEVLRFDLPTQGLHVIGEARVLREQAPNVYALRFESIIDGTVQHLSAITS
jgi:hypothetical protein